MFIYVVAIDCMRLQLTHFQSLGEKEELVMSLNLLSHVCLSLRECLPFVATAETNTYKPTYVFPDDDDLESEKEGN